MRLDRAEHALRKRKEGEPAIVPGKPDESPLVQRIESKDEKKIMPPPEAHKTLKPDQIALLRQWITEGAEYQEHWAFIAPVRPAVPVIGKTVVSSQSAVPGAQSARTGSSLITAPPITDYSSRNPIDAFVRAKLEKEGLTPAPEADRRTLIRRVTLDLTGLPPKRA